MASKVEGSKLDVADGKLFRSWVKFVSFRFSFFMGLGLKLESKRERTWMQGRLKNCDSVILHNR